MVTFRGIIPTDDDNIKSAGIPLCIVSALPSKEKLWVGTLRGIKTSCRRNTSIYGYTCFNSIHCTTHKWCEQVMEE